PQPDGPIRLTKRPAGIDSVTGASAWNEPVGVLNVMRTSSTQSFGGEGGMDAPADRAEARWVPSPRDYIAKTMPAATAAGLCVSPAGASSTSQADDGKSIRRA